jgi:succinate-acetate transporter protein
VLSAVNVGLISAAAATIALPVALFYGGAAQVVAGIWEFRKGNTFGATAFTSYGAFWLAYWGLSVFFKPAAGTTTSAIDTAVGCFLLGWTIFTAIMLIAALQTNRALILVFAVLLLTFALLTLAKFDASTTMDHAGGWTGLATAALAWYTALAGLVRETWKRPLFPIGSLN